MPTSRPEYSSESSINRKTRKKEANRIIARAISTVLQSRQIVGRNKYLLNQARSQLVFLAYQNYEDIKSLSNEEITQSLLEYMSYLNNAVYSYTLHTNLPRASRAASIAARFRPCCSEYPGTFPLCNRKC